MTMKTASFAGWMRAGLVASLTGLVACGQIVSLGDRTCAGGGCSPGWSCNESYVCVQGDAGGADGLLQGDAEAPDGSLHCSGPIDLGDQPIVGAGASTPPDLVMGVSKGPLQNDKQVLFDYSLSSWPTPQGADTFGWLVAAAAGEKLSFDVAASLVGGTTVALPFAVYGPIRESDASECSGPLASGVMTGSSATWAVTISGSYFVAPYHQVTETDAGLAIQGWKDNLYSSAFLVEHVIEE
jgi:hypothetical protein